MKRRSAALLASTAVLLAATGCGGGDTAPTRSGAAAPPPASSADYVASPTLGRGTSERLFAIPELGAFRASCTRPAEARISYRVNRGGTTQLVTAETARGGGLNRRVDPGERVAVAIRASEAARADWQAGIIAEGRIAVVTASFTVGRLGDFCCFVTAKAHRARRAR
jgi:hypothetical protein